MTATLRLLARHRGGLLVLILAAAIACARGLYVAPGRTWPNLLLNGLYVTSLSVSAMFFLASQRLCGARWSAGLRRIPEALMLAIPVCAALMLAVFPGRGWIFPWSRPGAFAHAPAIAGKVVYLNTPFVFARMVAVLGLWIAFAAGFRRASLAQDQSPGSSLSWHRRMNCYAALFVLAFAISFTVGSFDWISSLDSDWFSTVFAIYVFAGTFVQGVAAITLAVVTLRRREPLRYLVTERHLHDLGKMLFAFSTFWAYIWVCQYLLIWYVDIPDEVTHYVKRTSGPWVLLFALNLVVNWIVPFLTLLPARAKTNPNRLKLVSLLLLFGHWLDLYMLLIPSVSSAPRIGFEEVLLAAGYMALFYLLFIRSLARAPLVPVNDPVLAADLRYRALGGEQ